MEKLYIYILALFILIFNQNISAQLNLIPNGDFEQGNIVRCHYTDHSSCYNTVAYWNNGIEGTCGLWTFDWYDIDFINQNASPQNLCFSNQIPNVVLSNRYIGFYGNTDYGREGIKCKLLKSLKPSHGYGLEFDLMTVLDADKENHETYLSDSTIIHIDFCTNDNHWCDHIEKSLKVTLGPNEVNDWHHIKLDFFYPYPPNPPKINNINSLPEWDVIVVYADDDNPRSYFFIDNMELYDYCDHPCTPEKIKQPISIPAPIPFLNNCLYYKDHGNLIKGPFFFHSENATDIYFRVWDRLGWNHSLVEKHIHDPSGISLNLPNGLEGYIFAWYGRNYNGNILPSYIYNYEVYIGNCNNYVYHSDKMYVEVDANLSIPSLPVYYSLPFNTDCCLPNIVLNQCDKSINTYEVSGTILAYDNYIIPTNGYIQFSAKETINLKNEFRAKKGCYFNANLKGCDPPDKTYYDDNLNINYLGDSLLNINDTIYFSLNIFPNPTKLHTNIIIHNLSLPTHLTIFLFNCYGKLIETIFNADATDRTMSFHIDTKEFSSGIYYVIVKTKEKMLTKKIIIL